MKSAIVFVLGLVLVLLAVAGSSVFAQEQDLETILRFEGGSASFRAWGGGPPETVHFDSTIVHGGRGAVRLERTAQSPNSFSTITKKIPLDFEGKWIEMRGFLRCEGVTQFTGLWLREDGPAGNLQFDNMQDQEVRGTSDWTEYSIRLPLDPNARELFFGVLLAGEGKVWADDLQLLVDGKTIALAPKREIVLTILDKDHEFDKGSGITLSTLGRDQIENVAVLGMVWGFLKYHHPRVAGGELHWDYELFRVLPEVLAAPDRDSGNRALSKWVERIGVPKKCDPCGEMPKDAHLLPRIDWIRDSKRLGSTLSQQLQTVYANRFSGSGQFYISQVEGVRNPVFEHELPYANQEPPDTGFRILSLFRLWNIVEYWAPYRDQIEDDWESVLREFLPRFVAANTSDAYVLELFAFVARIQDGHANLWSDLKARPPRGDCSWPVEVRFVEDRATVIAVVDSLQEPAFGLQIGDVIESIDGRPVDALAKEWLPYYSGSNRTSRLRDIAYSLSRGECGECAVTVERDGSVRSTSVPRMAAKNVPRTPHDRPGETFQLLSPEVAYIKLSSIRVKDIAGYLEKASGTRGLVIDIRNYPSEFVPFFLGGHFVREVTPFARFTNGDLSNPGAFTWTPPVELVPLTPFYEGKVAILVDEVSLSQSEYTAMAFRAGPNAIVVGSTTAGADGNVSRIPLPGGRQTMISGIGVFYPDKTPTQRVGIVPDIVATPTIAGTREGRDEMLEKAVRQILGPDADEAMIRRMAARSHSP